MRMISWNIRSGGGRRVAEIVAQLARWQPDVVALMEFRATPPSQALATGVAELGLSYQLTSVDTTSPATNGLLLAARRPLSPLPTPIVWDMPTRWLLAQVDADRPLTVGVMHAPNFVGGRKAIYLDQVLAAVDGWPTDTGLLIGDTNSGLPHIDEESRAFMALERDWIHALDRRGWVDVYRRLHGEERVYTWYSPNGGNGFRLDQAFANPTLQPSVKSMRYAWGQRGFLDERRDSLSDHAAIVLEME